MIIASTAFAQPLANTNNKFTGAETDATQNSQWNGKKVAFLGDSMTQKFNKENTVYWEFLKDLLGIEPFVYGISGNQWDGIYRQALKLTEEKGENVDAILIFAGTNDYNHGLPLGNFFTETLKETNHNGKQVVRKFRTPVFNDSTFCGRINKVMDYLKTTYPDKQIIILTPIHRGFAQFSESNIQPDENFANEQGLYIDEYINILREAASVWAVPIIDLFSVSGLFPLQDSHGRYFKNIKTDRLHLSSDGNYRLAKTIQYQLLSLPSNFNE
ncbi:MAG: SGNH/GDSL hydrolase family protein [Draconibacterium sp.]|nr:SGNH/GDSL hydrolase family protein [Draconibacterium sp.]